MTIQGLIRQALFDLFVAFLLEILLVVHEVIFPVTGQGIIEYFPSGPRHTVRAFIPVSVSRVIISLSSSPEVGLTVTHTVVASNLTLVIAADLAFAFGLILQISQLTFIHKFTVVIGFVVTGAQHRIIDFLQIRAVLSYILHCVIYQIF